jgi:hypothetical protein
MLRLILLAVLVARCAPILKLFNKLALGIVLSVTVPLTDKLDKLLPLQVMFILKTPLRLKDLVPSELWVTQISFVYRVFVILEPVMPPEYEKLVPCNVPVFVALKFT